MCARWKEGDLDGTIEYSMQEWSSPTAEHRLAQFAPKGNATAQKLQQRNSASKSQCNSAKVATMWLVPEWDNSALPDNTRCCNSARCISAASAAKTPLATSRPLCFRHSTSAPGLGPHPRRDSAHIRAGTQVRSTRRCAPCCIGSARTPPTGHRRCARARGLRIRPCRGVRAVPCVPCGARA